MKKTIIFGAIALLGASSLTSCKKAWTCDCTFNYSGTSTTTSLPITDQKKKDAKTICGAYDKTYGTAYMSLDGYSGSCELK